MTGYGWIVSKPVKAGKCGCEICNRVRGRKAVCECCLTCTALTSVWSWSELHTWDFNIWQPPVHIRHLSLFFSSNTIIQYYPIYPHFLSVYLVKPYHNHRDHSTDSCQLPLSRALTCSSFICNHILSNLIISLWTFFHALSSTYNMVFL